MQISKIKTKEEVEKKQKKKQFYLVVALVFILVTSILGYAFNVSEKNTTGQNEKEIYGNFIFERYGNYWKVSIKDDKGNINQNLNFYFRYSPKDLYEIYNFSEFIKVISDLKTIDSYYQKPLYIYSENDNAKSEVLTNLFYSSKIVERVQEACLDYSSINLSKEDNCTQENKDYPMKTCEDNFIIIEENKDNSSESSLNQIENCLFIKGNSEDLTKATDEALFKVLGIK
ncbi:hypothetical protein GYA25_02745 [Candidatus Woesearchaeota archaeon]|nr:hypothetical protein [Candidatus Woesearchaeota archaeon]